MGTTSMAPVYFLLSCILIFSFCSEIAPVNVIIGRFTYLLIAFIIQLLYNAAVLYCVFVLFCCWLSFA